MKFSITINLTKSMTKIKRTERKSQNIFPLESVHILLDDFYATFFTGILTNSHSKIAYPEVYYELVDI